MVTQMSTTYKGSRDLENKVIVRITLLKPRMTPKYNQKSQQGRALNPQAPFWPCVRKSYTYSHTQDFEVANSKTQLTPYRVAALGCLSSKHWPGFRLLVSTCPNP